MDRVRAEHCIYAMNLIKRKPSELTLIIETKDYEEYFNKYINKEVPYTKEEYEYLKRTLGAWKLKKKNKALQAKLFEVVK